jgi:arginine/ornithine N-succinyltransferase beta subunit
VGRLAAPPGGSPTAIVATPEPTRFRAVRSAVGDDDGGAVLDRAVADRLGAEPGAEILVVEDARG